MLIPEEHLPMRIVAALLTSIFYTLLLLVVRCEDALIVAAAVPLACKLRRLKWEEIALALAAVTESSSG